MKYSWLARISLVAALCAPTFALANNPAVPVVRSAHQTPRKGQSLSSVTTVCKHCASITHSSGKTHRPPPGTGGYESAGYGDDGGGFRVKPNGGVQHTPPLEPVTGTVQAATQAGAP